MSAKITLISKLAFKISKRISFFAIFRVIFPSKLKFIKDYTILNGARECFENLITVIPCIK